MCFENKLFFPTDTSFVTFIYASSYMYGAVKKYHLNSLKAYFHDLKPEKISCEITDLRDTGCSFILFTAVIPEHGMSRTFAKIKLSRIKPVLQYRVN